MTTYTPPLVPDNLARTLLAFEAENPAPRGGVKEDLIRRTLHMSAPRYWQLLLRLVETEQALRIDPMTTHRLRRIQAESDRSRAARLGQPTT